MIVGAGLFGRRFRPGSYPTRTRESSASTSSSRPALRSSGRSVRAAGRWRISSPRPTGSMSYQTIGGYGAVTSTYQPNFGTIFVRLKPWEERKGEALHVKGIMAGLQRQFAAHSRGDHLPVQHPDALRIRGRVRVQFPAAGPQRFDDCRPARRCRRGSSSRRQGSGRSSGTCSARSTRTTRRSRWNSTARRRARWACRSNDVFQAMSTAMGGSYVNDFNRFGRLYRVYAQAEADTRLNTEDIGKIYVRSKTTNEMVPLSTLVTISEIAGTRAHDPVQPAALRRDPGRARAPATPPDRRSPRWSRCSRRRCRRRWASPTRRCPTRRRSRRRRRRRSSMAIVCVFLLLAALYESWRLPWAVLLGLAARRARRILRRVADGLRQQRLRADRPRHADRPRRQERDPDRRVRQGEARRGHVRSRKRRSNRRGCASGRS